MRALVAFLSDPVFAQTRPIFSLCMALPFFLLPGQVPETLSCVGCRHCLLFPRSHLRADPPSSLVSVVTTFLDRGSDHVPVPPPPFPSFSSGNLASPASFTKLSLPVGSQWRHRPIFFPSVFSFSTQCYPLTHRFATQIGLGLGPLSSATASPL